MNRPARIVTAVILAVLAVCASALLIGTCGGHGMCSVETVAAGSVLAIAVAGLATIVIVTLAHATHQLRSAERAIMQLPVRRAMPALAEAMMRTGITGVVCIHDGDPAAFTAGALRPRTYITSELVDRLTPSELDSVLIHEQWHVRRRDPLRQALWTAMSDTLFFVPALAWWARQRRASAEIAADLGAVGLVGRRHVAGALLAVAECERYPGSSTALAPRVAALLGEVPIARRPPAHDVLGSVAGVAMTLAMMLCAGTLPGL